MANTKLDIRTGLIVGVIDANLSYPIQWPNLPVQTSSTDNTPKDPNDEPWLRITILSMEDGVSTLGANGRDEVIGAMQVDIFVPKGSGDIKAYQIMEEIRATLTRGKTLTHNGQFVRITSAGSRQGQDEPNWYSQIINVDFNSYLTRS
ncbi:MAG: phage tail terminator-like protein [Oleiphilaceae bacterium]|nr:phage tail terminator-like protein [Oleiphilaceae bacterium]